MKNILLAGAFLAVLASPAFAEDPYSAKDPYAGDARHLNAPYDKSGKEMSPGQSSMGMAPAAAPSQSTVGSGGAWNTNDGPDGAVIRDGQVVGKDPDPRIRALIGQDYDRRGRP